MIDLLYNSPYERGWLARERGRTISLNPYMHGTGAYIAWRAGWNDCAGRA